MKCTVFCTAFIWMFHFSASQQQREGSGLPVDNSVQGMLSSMESGGNDATTENTPFRHLVPTTPNPESVNCYVELPAVRITGQCVRLGRVRWRGRARSRSRSRSRPRSYVAWGCQSGIHLDFGSRECNAYALRRTESPNRRGQ